MDELQRALDRALEAAGAHPRIRPYVERAVALARFQAHDPPGGPFRKHPFSAGVPLLPVQHARPELRAAIDALDALQSELVWAAERAEFSDATNNARQFLQAAGHVDLAARALLGPEGLAAWPAVYVRDLAAATGLDLSALVPALGMLPPNERGVFASFAWDIHHEAPVSDPHQLGARELTAYRVGGIAWEAPRPQPAPLGTRLEQVRTPEDLAALAPVFALELAAALGAPDAFARTVDVHMSSWQLSTPDGPLRLGEWTVVATLDGAPSGPPLEHIHLPAARAAALGPRDVVRSLRAG